MMFTLKKLGFWFSSKNTLQTVSGLNHSGGLNIQGDPQAAVGTIPTEIPVVAPVLPIVLVAEDEEEEEEVVVVPDRWDDKYGDEAADVVITSSDGVKFRVFSFYLKAYR